MNKVILMGRLVRDPEIRYSQDGKAVAKYTLAVDRIGRDNGADFISCVSFEKTAEFAEKYLRKGTKVLAEGSITTGSYTNKDGQKVYTTEVKVVACEFAESKKAEETQAQEAPAQEPANKADKTGFMDVPDDIGLPFN